MYRNEKEVAKKAEEILTSALRQKTGSFRDHLNRIPGQRSLKEASGKARLKKYGTRRNNSLEYFMRSLAIRMEKHGFVQHFGVDTVRNSGARTRTRPNSTTYGFKSHVMKMPAQTFINQAVESSKVIDFVMENISRIRSEEILFEIKKILENQ